MPNYKLSSPVKMAGSDKHHPRDVASWVLIAFVWNEIGIIISERTVSSGGTYNCLQASYFLLAACSRAYLFLKNSFLIRPILSISR